MGRDTYSLREGATKEVAGFLTGGGATGVVPHFFAGKEL